GNISADPRFASRRYGDLHVQPDSPCVDAGDGSALSAGATDIDGQPRILAGGVDIGADESDGTLWPDGPRTVRVRPDGDHHNDGSSWASAMRTPQAAVDGMALRGGEVWIAAGTYYGRTSSGPGISLLGGFAGT